MTWLDILGKEFIPVISLINLKMNIRSQYIHFSGPLADQLVRGS